MIPYFRFSRCPWGTVYLMQSRRDQTLFKVGFTGRKTFERRAELNRVAGDDMKIVMTVTMPWARKCETLMLRRLRRHLFRKRERRGTEWFRRRETIDHIAIGLERAAWNIEFIARWKFSWPKECKARVFKADPNYSKKRNLLSCLKKIRRAELMSACV